MLRTFTLILFATLFAGWTASHGTMRGQTSPQHPSCIFQHTADGFAGSCGSLFDQTPAMTLRPAAAIKSGVWREDMRPESVWAGDMTDKGYPNAPLELEVYPGGWGVLRTEYGWFPITHFASSPALTFDLDAAHEVPPNALDQKIVLQAAQLLTTGAAWNRADDRNCPADAKSWSIYCAMEKASVAVTGGSHHRRAAMEVVRAIVDERTADRNYHHRLMDYNNDPSTHLGDVQSLFQEALRRMRSQAAIPVSPLQ